MCIASGFVKNIDRSAIESFKLNYKCAQKFKLVKILYTIYTLNILAQLIFTIFYMKNKSTRVIQFNNKENQIIYIYLLLLLQRVFLSLMCILNPNFELQKFAIELQSQIKYLHMLILTKKYL